MKCLSVRQPWAWAIINGGKDVENRNWPTKFRGELAIHASLKFDMGRKDWEDFIAGRYGEPYTSMAAGWVNHINKGEWWFMGHFGAIIGTVEVYDCIPSEACDSEWKAEGDDFYCWLLRNPQALREPIPYQGALGLFNIPDLEVA